MSIRTFPLAAIQKVRQYIQNTLVVSDIEPSQPLSTLNSDELPEPESIDELSGLFTFGGGSETNVIPINAYNPWFISTVNPGAALLKLPGLKLKPEFRLVSYLYRSEGSGVGIVWAVPVALSTTAHLEKALIASKSIAQIPKPEGALSHFMDAIEGDRSPASFVIASILRRELQEFGVVGQRRNWSHHRLIDTIPAKLNWTWRSEQPKNLLPKAKHLTNNQVAVEFFTCRVVAPITIYRHIEQYPDGRYTAVSVDRSIAVAQ